MWWLEVGRGRVGGKARQCRPEMGRGKGRLGLGWWPDVVAAADK